MVVQLGLAMMPRGRFFASEAFTSGTTNGTSFSIRKAEELSIITAPYFVISSANSLEVPAPADVNTKSMSLKSSLCFNSFTVSFSPLKSYTLPALRDEPNRLKEVNGKLRSAKTRKNSWPTAPLAPTIATLIVVKFWLFVCLVKRNLLASDFLC